MHTNRATLKKRRNFLQPTKRGCIPRTIIEQTESKTGDGFFGQLAASFVGNHSYKPNS